LKNKRDLVAAIIKEIDLNHAFLESDSIDTLYFGGGTPSVLTKEELIAITSKVKEYFSFNDGLEFTLEANPDDLNDAYLVDLRTVGVNRLSVGIQSFFDSELELMNRSHNATQARKAIELIKAGAFDDYSIDLIFGMPGSSLKSWEENLEIAIAYEAPHFSFYNLTVEPRTALDHMIRKGQVNPLSDAVMAEQFQFTMDYMKRSGYEHYEISNYALPGRYAKHNTAYWQGKSYLGIGPSAHSFKGNVRQWNIANNARYIKAINIGELPVEKEFLSNSDQYNEYMMTGLRTQWGINTEKVQSFGKDLLSHFTNSIQKQIDSGKVLKNADQYVLTQKGKLFADEVASELFFDDSSSK